MFIVIILVLIYDCHNVNGHHVFAIKYAWCPTFTIISRSTFGINSVTYFRKQYIDNKFHIISSSTNTSSFNTRLLIHVYILDASLHRQVYRPLTDEHAAFYCTWISSQQPLLPQSVNATIIYNEQFFCRYSITTVCYNRFLILNTVAWFINHITGESVDAGVKFRSSTLTSINYHTGQNNNTIKKFGENCYCM